ncbi:SDR family NAD(P)-dependent oxidoreductase [Sphingobium scionense]
MTEIALVTGGTRGIGAAIAVALKAQGWEVASIYHGNDKARAVQQGNGDIGLPLGRRG